VTVPNEHLLILAGILFAIGVGGFFIRRNVIIVLLSVELMLNAANLTLIAGSRMHSSPAAGDMQGPAFAVFVILVAAVEAAVGLALVIALFRKKQTVSLEAVNELRS
jgi:NADH-quinone oxidoreductase subunit K